ncbi:MAG: NlpC/P60 family protein [bacterium]|nr:NlpC/P60 family protein [bacterium]
MNPSKTIYVTLDLRRALWVSEAVGATVLCSYQSDMLSWMREQGTAVRCFEEEFPGAVIPGSTFLILSRALTLNWLRSLKADLKFLVFKPSNKIRRWIEEQGWDLVSADVKVCRELEDKISFAGLAVKHALPMPEHRIVLWDEKQHHAYHDELGDEIVVQGRMGHAGSSSFFSKRNELFAPLVQGTQVKISRFVSGNTYTLNGYVDAQGKMAFGPLWQQMMNMKVWNHFQFGTVGVSPTLDLNDEILSKLRKELEKKGPLFREVGYIGFFGLDLIWNGEQWYLIECNPRLTASISLQCLMDVVNEREPLLKLHAERASLKEHRFDFLDKDGKLFGQIILRNTKDRAWKTPKTLKSGIYAFDGQDWKLRLRSFDARELEEGELLLLLSHLPNTAIDPGSDYASIQFKGSAYDAHDDVASAPSNPFEGGNHPTRHHFKDIFIDFYERVVIGFRIREKDIWNDRFVKMKESAPLLRKPIPKPHLDRNRQTEVQAGEVLKLLGEQGDFFLVKKADKTRGWLSKSVSLEEMGPVESFELPNKASTNAEDFFENWKGTPYGWGGNSEQGIDCSAFVQRYFWEVKGILLPKYSQDQKSFCSGKVERNELQNDDLVFLHSRKKHISHVGIVRGTKVWHSGLKMGVMEEDLAELERRYVLEGFWRI